MTAGALLWSTCNMPPSQMRPYHHCLQNRLLNSSIVLTMLPRVHCRMNIRISSHKVMGHMARGLWQHGVKNCAVQRKESAKKVCNDCRICLNYLINRCCRKVQILRYFRIRSMLLNNAQYLDARRVIDGIVLRRTLTLHHLRRIY